MNIENVKSIIESLKPALEVLSQKIGEGGAYAFELAVRQQYVDGAIGAFVAIVGIITLIALVKGWSALEKWKEDGGSYSGREPLFYILVITVVAFAIPMFIFGTITAIQHFMNPEWQAIVDIAKLVNPRSTN